MLPSYLSPHIVVARIHVAGASSGWAGCVLEVHGLQALQDHMVIIRVMFVITFVWGGWVFSVSDLVVE